MTPERRAELRRLTHPSRISREGGDWGTPVVVELLDALDETYQALFDAGEVIIACDAELAAWHGECDKVGVPYDPPGLVRHHRNNASMATGFAMYARSLVFERQLDALRAYCTRRNAGTRPESPNLISTRDVLAILDGPQP